MTTCGYFWTIVVIVLAIIGVAISAVSAGKNQSKAQQSGFALEKEKGRSGSKAFAMSGGSGAERVSFDAPGVIAYRRGGARYVTCQASTRLDDGYIVSLGGRSGADLTRMTLYAKKELAAVLAEQALAAGGIEFSTVGGELRAVMRTITGREEGAEL